MKNLFYRKESRSAPTSLTSTVSPARTFTSAGSAEVTSTQTTSSGGWYNKLSPSLFFSFLFFLFSTLSFPFLLVARVLVFIFFLQNTLVSRGIHLLIAVCPLLWFIDPLVKFMLRDELAIGFRRNVKIPFCSPYGFETCLFTATVEQFGYLPTVFILGMKPCDTRYNIRVVKHYGLAKMRLPFFASRPGLPSVPHVSLFEFTGSFPHPTFAYLATHDHLDPRGDDTSDTKRVIDTFLSPAVPALGGVRVTLSQMPVTGVSRSLTERWYPGKFPRQMTHTAVDWHVQRDPGALRVHRSNEYTRMFPDSSTRARLPSLFTDTMPSTLLFTPREDRTHILSAQYDRRWNLDQPVRTLSGPYAALARVLDGDTSRDALVAADQTVAIDRFLDTRGNRQVERWEADQWPRWMGLATFCSWANTRQSYFEAAYRLWTRYFFARIFEDFHSSNPTATMGVDGTGTACVLTFINAVPVTGPNAPNPEGPMWTDDAQSGLKNGTKQFIDAQGLSENELLELISALAPLDDKDYIPHFLLNSGDGDVKYINPFMRYLFLNGTDEIFIHYGNNPIPDLATQGRITANVFSVPKPTAIASVLRLLASRHGAERDIIDALETVMYRGVGYHSDDFINRRKNYTSGEVLHSDGNWEFHSLRNYTAGGYFDALRVPVPLDQKIQYSLALPSEELINNLIFVSHARATSLSWAAFALSMTGRTWANLPGNEANQFVANHIDVWLRTYNNENLDLWATVSANAMAYQYGYAPSQRARSTEALRIAHFWSNFQIPTLTNHYHELWMMEIMPTFQLLPYHDNEGTSHPTWDSGSPAPVADFASFQGDVQLGRDLAAFTGRTWLGDGGYTHNAQFFAAQGVDDQFRFEGHTPAFQLAYWQHQMVHQFPQNPSAFTPVWMATQGSPFADFLLPGSLAGINLERNRTYAWGVRLPTGAAHRSDPIWRRWHQLGLQAPRQSLMVNYVHPLRERREIESLEDYSVLIWEDQNRFAGMSLIRYDMPNGSADTRFDPGTVPLSKAFDLPGASAGPATTLSNPRVTARRVMGRDPNLMGRVQAVMRPRGAVVNSPPIIEYRAKHPLTTDDVPRMDTYNAEMDERGITVGQEFIRPGDMPKTRYEPPLADGVQDTSHLHRQLQQKEYEMDQAHQAWLAAEQIKAAKSRAAYADLQARQAERVARGRSLPPRPKAPSVQRQPSKRNSDPPKTRVPGGDKVTTAFEAHIPHGQRLPAGPVAPNDAPAGEAQASLQQQQENLQRFIDNQSRLRPHSRQSDRPAQRQFDVPARPSEDQPTRPPYKHVPEGGGAFGPPPQPFEELAARIKLDQVTDGPDVYADRSNADAYIPSFEQVEGLKRPENFSGAQSYW